MKKAVIFVALVSVVFFSNCKNNTEAAPEEQMEQTVIDSTVTVTDSIKTDEVTPEVATKDTLTTPAVK
ncbi:hypothetical protein FNW52_17625 [Flavobacterium sp. ZT3R18]|uniref:hypothetical protein n=1 Tax=Flavobacterium sp. ZT3R18 TaxID=2594429 RepID=UPI00117A3A55|nr:hypothetical protein [Flavobacterium sp. ZT3R18]TRX32253.1 hypothetical protein FNW52_17625 [Flavobacterium sp. ZT3R18]